MREADLFNLLAGASEASFVVDQRGLIRFWNRSAERLLGLPAREALDRPCAAIVNGMDSAGNRCCMPNCAVLEVAQRTTEVPPYDLQVRTADGQHKWVNVSIIVTPPGHKGERLVVHFMRDIGARKSLENLTKEIAVHVGRLTNREADDLLNPAQPPVPAVELTTQERRILRCLSLGRNTAAIASELHVSPLTVRNHVYHILRKLGAHTRLEAVMRAAREKLI
jgi:PAS domain S-box-containing protein